MVDVRCFGTVASPLPVHGGNLTWAQQAFPAAPRPWLDLSTGINPWAYSDEASADWSRLPEQAALDQLLSAARTYYSVVPQREIVAVAGVELAIRMLPLILSVHGPVCVAGPTYGSHADAWQSAGHNVAVLPAHSAFSGDCDVAVIVSPNNPDGRTTNTDQLNALARQVQWLIADRSFADICHEPQALRGPDNLIELRSFGKFFGLPGMRMGFVIAEPGLANKLRSVLGAWPLNSAALAIGEKALCDTAWHAASRERLRRAAVSLNDVLARHLEVVGGTDLFRLVRLPRAADLFRHLGSRGILTRIFDHDSSWVRIGLPGDAEARLAGALADFFGTRS